MIVAREDGLHRSLAEGLRTDDQRASLILQCAGHDLTCARGSSVHQHNHRIRIEAGLGMREILLALAFLAALRIDDHPAIEKLISNFHGLAQQTAGIVPEIEYQPANSAMLLLL